MAEPPIDPWQDVERAAAAASHRYREGFTATWADVHSLVAAVSGLASARADALAQHRADLAAKDAEIATLQQEIADADLAFAHATETADRELAHATERADDATDRAEFAARALADLQTQIRQTVETWRQMIDQLGANPIFGGEVVGLSTCANQLDAILPLDTETSDGR